MSEKTNSINDSRPMAAVRWIVLVLILIAFGIIILATTAKPSTSSEIWDERTTIGKKDAKNHFIMYTDAMCPYCAFFSRAVMSEQEQFEKYLEDNDVVFEMRITNLLSDVTGESSTRSAEAILCATEQDRFWDYYHTMIATINADYYSKGIGNSKTSPKITGLNDDYWKKIAKTAGINEAEFDDCYLNHKTLEKVVENTTKTIKVFSEDQHSGMPYFVFGKLKTSGFDSSWGWDYVKNMFDVGLKK